MASASSVASGEWVRVYSRVTVPPGSTGSSVKDLVRAIGVTVTSRASLALPLDTFTSFGTVPTREVSSPETLVKVPTALPMTSTETVQVEGIMKLTAPLLKLMTLDPGTAVTTPVDMLKEQVVAAFEGPATTIPVGRISVKLMIKAAVLFNELSMVKVRVLRPPRLTEAGAKLLLNPGRSVATVRVSLAVPLSGAEDIRTLLVFMWAPTVLAVTSTLTVQVSPTPRTPPLKVMVPPPAGAVTTPRRQVVEALAGVAMSTSPGIVGSTSVNAMSVIGTVSVLVMVKVSVETLPGPIVSGVKTLVKVGGEAVAGFN